MEVDLHGFFAENWVDSTMKNGGLTGVDGFQKDFFWIEL